MWRLAIALVIVLGLLIGAGRWLAAHREASQRTADQTPVTTPENSDYYLKDATIYQLTPEGRLAYRAHSVEALHFPDDSARLSDIDVRYVKGTPTYWHLHANKGHVPADQPHSLYLYDGVTGRHPRDNGAMVRLETTHAWVYPDRNLIESDAHVKAFEPGQTVTGDGMRVNLETNKLNLLNNVHVTYAP
ncbi:LPS export ABC transporter periplasmic protein LptC [Salinisphaera sp. Q1T1-3]|uniref:LPS export ABC transporter periplasmic protein LptC n=1 Tax=Salinisphaera sp. Q1T1-3 TaxID=2321229 RepID=UPI000E733324|nr:LPS export ABC transporter periplasmic protein LptC [Salinisphaera sp. Q1T1-3]RJS92245.1 LPS export ABC transporter periplasmic protein LptC [Salinisphaera sp. Q1T1-3]